MTPPPPRTLTTVGGVALVLGGVAAVVLGIVALARPSAAFPVLGLAFGLWLLSEGLSRTTLAARSRSAPAWYRVLSGVLGAALLVAGVVALANLTRSAEVLALLVGVGFSLAAVVDVVMWLATGRRNAWLPGLAIVHALVAALFLTSPGAGLTVVTVLLGLVLLLVGPAAMAGGLLLWRLGRLIGRRRDDGPDDIRVIEAEIL
ncbi:MAG: DUF308 domain-containing protein [Kineosporiaceae bacterium]